MTEALRPQTGGRVLVVEDEWLIRDYLVEQLSDHGFDVIAATHGEEALVILADTPVDVVVTDVKMPGAIDGVRLAKLLRHERPEIDVVVLSGHAAAADLPEDVPLVRKPYKIGELLWTICNFAPREKRCG
jgi:CheY-like chemotaxis protein